MQWRREDHGLLFCGVDENVGFRSLAIPEFADGPRQFAQGRRVEPSRPVEVKRPNDQAHDAVRVRLLLVQPNC